MRTKIKIINKSKSNKHDTKTIKMNKTAMIMIMIVAMITNIFKQLSLEKHFHPYGIFQEIINKNEKINKQKILKKYKWWLIFMP